MGVLLSCSSFFLKDLGMSIGPRKTKMTTEGESRGQSFLPGPPAPKPGLFPAITANSFHLLQMENLRLSDYYGLTDDGGVGLKGPGSGRRVGHAHLQAIDIIRWHDTRSVCSHLGCF